MHGARRRRDAERWSPSQRLQAAYGDAVTRRAWDDVRALFEPDAVVHIDTRTREPVHASKGPTRWSTSSSAALEPFAFFEFAILNAVADVDGDRGHRAACTSASSVTTGRGVDRGLRPLPGPLRPPRRRLADRSGALQRPRHYTSSLARNGRPATGIESFELPFRPTRVERGAGQVT